MKSLKVLKVDIPLIMNYTYIQRKLMEKEFEPIAKKYELKLSELTLLMVLVLNPEISTAQEITEFSEMKSGNVSVLVEGLCNKGLLEQQPFENDRRMKKLVLTDKSEPILNECGEILDFFFTQSLNDIAKEDLDVCEKVFKKMYENMTNIQKIKMEEK